MILTTTRLILFCVRHCTKAHIHNLHPPPHTHTVTFPKIPDLEKPRDSVISNLPNVQG